jgi:ferredoxin
MIVEGGRRIEEGVRIMSMSWRIHVDASVCVGSSTFLFTAPDVFVIKSGIAEVNRFSQEQIEIVRAAAESCPVGAIIIEEQGEDA